MSIKDRMSQLLRKDETPVNHPIFTGEIPVAMISAENPKFPTPVDHASAHEAMGHELRQRGYKFDSTHGKYEKPEKSFIVYNPKMHDLFDLSKKYGQESFVYSAGGDKKLIYANGPKENQYNPSTPDVTVSPTAPDDYYTYVPNVGYVTLGFDFDKTQPLEHQEASAGGHPTMSKSEVSVQLQDLAASLRKKLEDSGFPMAKSDANDNPDYTHYVVTPHGKIHSGWEYKDDAEDARKDSGVAGSKVYHRRSLGAKGINPKDNSHWHTGADFQKSEYTPEEVVQAIGKLVKSRIDAYETELLALRKREESSVGRGPHEESSAGVLPGDKKPKVIPSPGSGGPVKKGEDKGTKEPTYDDRQKRAWETLMAPEPKPLHPSDKKRGIPGKGLKKNAGVPTAKPPTAPPTPAKPPASTPATPKPAAPAAPAKPAGAPMGKSLFNVKAEPNAAGAAKPRPGIFGKMTSC